MRYNEDDACWSLYCRKAWNCCVVGTLNGIWWWWNNSVKLFFFSMAWKWNPTKEVSWFQTFTVLWMLHAFFWVIPWHLNFICQHFGPHCLFHPTRLWRWNRQCVAKGWHIKFKCQGVTQKKAYNKEVSVMHHVTENNTLFHYFWKLTQYNFGCIVIMCRFC
jgi:hypothetical protein